jgi:HAD superfamily hydrolase (TIGR01509 family)
MSRGERRYLLLDAGGTLVYPHSAHIEEACRQRGRALAPNAFLGAFFRAIHRLDEALRRGVGLTPPEDFVTSAIAAAGADLDTAKHALAAAKSACAPASLWTFALPWARPALERLHRGGFRMSVVSNSDGTVRQQMIDLDLARYFEGVFDSRELGFEKPDPRIFHAVLEAQKLHPDECLYVGDVMMIDVVGANAAGIAGVHLDPFGLYAGWPGIHFANLDALTDALLDESFEDRAPDFFPFAPR